MPLWQSSCMDPIWPEFEIWKIFHRRPAEILAPWTPGVSHGTKIFGSKIFSYHPQMMLFYAFWRLLLQKLLKIKKNCLFLQYSFIIGKSYKIDSFSWFFAFFAKQIPKMHKITSFEDDMRKFSSQKFWSHGTSLGSLGPLSQEDVPQRFVRPHFLVK